MNNDDEHLLTVECCIQMLVSQSRHQAFEFALMHLQYFWTQMFQFHAAVLAKCPALEVGLKHNQRTDGCT